MAFPKVQGMKRLRQGPNEQMLSCQGKRNQKWAKHNKKINDSAQNVRVQRTRQGQRMILSYDYSRISGYELSENTKIIIHSYDYAQNFRVRRTRQGQRTMLSYDYSRISGHELSENTKIIILSYDYA